MEWKALMESGPFEIVEWAEMKAAFAVEVLGEYPSIPSTLLHGAAANDMVMSRVHVWLRKRSG
jgi:hypothetical protein